MKSTEAKLYIDGVLANTNPIFSDKISIDKERESGEMFRRTKLNSEFRFVGSDYDRIFNSNLDTDFEIRVYGKETNIQYLKQLARGTFKKTDCKFDTDNKICTVKTNSADEYDKILAGLNDEFDLVGLAPVREKIKLTKRAILQIYVFHDTKISNIIGNMSYEVDVASGVEVNELTTSDLTNTYNFSQVGTGGIEVYVTGMPSSLVALEGTYIGNWNGGGTVLTQEGGTYKIVMGNRSMAGGTWLFWEFKDGNNNPVYIYSEGGNRLVTTQPLPNQLPAQSQLNTWGYEQRRSGSQSFIWQKSDAMVASVDEKTIFARVLLDYIPYDLAIGDVMRISAEDICATNLNYHYSMKADGISQLSGWIVKSTTVQDAPTKWGVNGEGKYFVQPSPISMGDNVIPIGWNRWIPKSIWLNSTSGLADILDLFDSEWELNDAYPLWSAIKVLLAKIDPSITFEGTSAYSQFLYGTISSSVIHGWVKQLLYITPITNVKKTYYNQAARKGKITLKQIFDMLRATCQLYWFIDSYNRLRIEHITWFRNGGNYSQQNPLIDLTSILSPMSRKNWSFGQNTFEYDKSALSKRYEFSWHEECSEAFDGFPIDIKNKYASKGNTEKSQATNFISDIDLIMSAPDALGDDSFALIGTDTSKRCPIQSIGNFGMDFVAPTYKMQNPYLSFYYTELAYWLYNVSGNKATTSDYKKRNGNDGKLRVYAVKRAKKQSVKFPISPNKAGKEGLITTALGTGEWTKSKYTPEDGMVDMEIIMETAEPLLVEYGSFTHLSTGVMDLDVEEGSHQMIFTFDGGKSEATDWGYTRITANKRVNVRIYASSESNYDIGWANSTAITTRVGALNAEHHASGTEGDSFYLNAGESIYIGYVKDSSWFANNDKITFDIIES